MKGLFVKLSATALMALLSVLSAQDIEGNHQNSIVIEQGESTSVNPQGTIEPGTVQSNPLRQDKMPGDDLPIFHLPVHGQYTGLSSPNADGNGVDKPLLHGRSYPDNPQMPQDTGRSTPPVPTLLSPPNGATISTQPITFTWSSSEGATKYWMEIATNSNFTNPAFSEDIGLRTSINVTGFQNNVTYYWRISAGNNSGWSYYSSSRYLIYSETGTNPDITVNPTGINFGNVNVGSNSAPKSYSLGWSNMNKNITITSDSDHYKVSLSQYGPFISSINLYAESKKIEKVSREPRSFNLFTDQTMIRHDIHEALHFYDARDVVQRFGEINLDDAIANYHLVRPDDSLILNLFEDAQYDAVITAVDENINRTVSVTAKLIGFDFAYAIITTTENRSLICIIIPELMVYYQVISDPVTLTHYIIEMNLNDRDILPSGSSLILESLSPEVIKEQERIKRDLEGRNTGPNDPANIDVMIVYTPAARTWANNSGGGIHNVIAQAMAEGQLVLSYRTWTTITLVHSALVNYVESGNPDVDLLRFTASPTFNPWGDIHEGYQIPGYMNEIHQWRDTYGADLCALFADITGVGGLGFRLSNENGNPDYGFSLSRVQQAAGHTYTHIHELGHNMGMGHHAQQNNAPGPGLFSYSSGWRWQLGGNWYASVMAYAAGTFYDPPAPGAGIDSSRIPVFSSPQVTHGGVPTGHPTQADNARTARETKHVVAAYRQLPTQNPYEIWVRFEPGTSGTLNSNISNSAADATTRNVSVTGFGSSSSTDVRNDDISNNINVYPNPSPGIFNIDFQDILSNPEIKIEVHDAMGVLLLNKNTFVHSAIEIDLSQHPSGIYFIRVSKENAIFNTRVIKICP